MPDFQWDTPSEEAAVLIAEGKLTSNEIAAKVGCSPRTMTNWRANDEFMAVVKKNADEIRKALLHRAITVKLRRIDRMNSDWFRMQAVRETRAADPSMVGIPGADTGLLVKTIKSIGQGDNLREVAEYTFGTPG